jgi:hypothetical protein
MVLHDKYVNMSLKTRTYQSFLQYLYTILGLAS